MLKATRLRAVLLGLLAAGFVTGPVFAEVQNVQVGGEFGVRSFFRKALRLNEDVFNGTGGGGAPATIYNAEADQGESGDEFLQQHTALDVEGDLTENVKVRTRLVNQRTWGSVADDATGTADAEANAVQVSLANVTLKELFYSPLTLILGRQNLWYGRGFIVGSRLLHGDNDQADGLAADEFSDLTGFDAARLVLDLGGAAPMGMPATLDAVYAKVDENTISTGGVAATNDDDTTLYGLNLGTKLDDMNGEAEVYYFRKLVQGTTLGSRAAHPVANTVGIRGSGAPADGSSIWAELAYQWGNAITTGGAIGTTLLTSEGAAGDRYQSWAANLGADFSLGDASMWSPKVGVEWIWYKGREGSLEGAGNGSDGMAINGWDPMYRGAFTTAIREFQGPGFYPVAQSGSTIIGTFNDITSSTSNQHQFAAHATVWPVEDLSVDNRLTYFMADVGIVPVDGAKRETNLGWEWDVQANYAYTDDVNLGLIYALFLPGSVFRNPHDAHAQELITAVNVKF